MSTSMATKVSDIMGDSRLSKDRKIEELRKLRAEARGVQRAGSESAMSADDGLQNDLRVVEKALGELDGDIEEKGAATL
ncbi:hypothetical protein [Rhizobium sp. RAF56]|jgi:hypothetical protein|uniref:hypothetical protein n=1 Tax=Rhizobium sp. RAF56 TaxID=3233062 RepID=UPI003F9A0DC2